MDDDLFAGHFKLDVTVQGDRSRQVSFESDPSKGIRNKRIVQIWTRERFLAENVYAERTNSGQVRVIKQILHRPANLENCLSELRAMGRVSKDNGLFVQFLGWFQSTDHVFFAMEYCPLGDISNCYHEPLPEVTARSIGRQVLEGLAKLHEIKIIHRDIKPQNILVLNKDPIWVKISDFGISKRVLEGRTELRTRAGTEGYVAPEVFGLLDDAAESSSYTSAVDIWSLGCLLHYLLTKSPPFGTLAALRDYCWEEEFPEEYLVAEGVGESGRAFIKELLTIEPAERPGARIDILARWKVDASRVQANPDRVAAQTSWMPEQTYAQVEYANQDDTMDYHSLELWNALNTPTTGIERITALLELSANPNKYRKGYTALHLATKKGTPEQVEIILDYGADVKATTRPYAETALHLAMDQRCMPKIKLLLSRGSNVNAQNVEGDTVFHLAISKGSSVETLTLFLENGADIEIKGRNGRSPLLYALSLDQEAKAGFLLAKGANPNTQDEGGRTPLHTAISSSRISCAFIRTLVQPGANIDQPDAHGSTPLHEAVKTSRNDVICLLVHSGITPHPELESRVKRALFWRNPASIIGWPFK